MIDYIMENYWLLWTIIGLVCLTLEMTSGDFFLTCFAIGAFGSAIATAFGMPFYGQVLTFALVSVLSICFLRPRLTAMLHRNGTERVSNADAIIDRIGTVSETIPVGGYGRVKIDGDDWKAQSDETDPIEKGMKVRVLSRDSIIISVASVD